ncbi:hypothetical protein [Curtobacterium sp. VKM Ac-2887]|uniref:hypothetical protein n=1 Tax=Curtobacterium sp. VKM Ac-2887 TaxID=2783819 RepID=UPI00188D3953|nr:hypothetical protein [Curtobacterium sp. VKM Ac-2887]MBF4588383.1 hypothetical protein [Curtobacterium sp. VKM Ac-2887]
MTTHQWLLVWDLGTLVVYVLAGAAVVLQLIARRLLRERRRYRPTSERSVLIEQLRAESGYDPSLPRGPK